MFIAILGRQPEISLAELKSVYGTANITLLTPDIAGINAQFVDLSILGGSTKIAEVVTTDNHRNRPDSQLFTDISKQIVHHYSNKWHNIDHKITLGISAYNFNIPPRSVQKTGIILKNALKKSEVSLRLIPNAENNLSTAISHNNKLGLSENKVEILVIKTADKIIVAESRGAQNITAYARRDHGKPKRDAFVGMLPPKLAQIMLNLALGEITDAEHLAGPYFSEETVTSEESRISAERSTKVPVALKEKSVLQRKRMGQSNETFEDFGNENTTSLTILDPFCGTGTVLQEALLRGLNVTGSDLSQKMIDYSTENLNWVISSHRHTGKIINLTAADATSHSWPNSHQISAVVCETYLGQPFSAPPSPAKLQEVTGNCNHIISSFLRNIHSQLKPGTPLCIAVPSWRSKDGHLTHLPLLRNLNKLGYNQTQPPLVYSRPDQVVAREILVLTVA